MLVGLFARPGIDRDAPRFYSPTKYRVDLSTGLVRSASENEWAGAQSSFMLLNSISRLSDLKPEDNLAYKGKEYIKRGAQWPLYSSADASRLSPDGGFLAVNSWGGEMKICSGDLLPEVWSCQDRIQGDYHIEIYETAAATLALSLTGQFQGFDPSDLFGRSAWISERYYFLPLYTLYMTPFMNHFALCDVNTGAKAN
jgi:hypothetical protein